MTDADLIAALGPCDGGHKCAVHDSTWHPSTIDPTADRVCWVQHHQLAGARAGIDLARTRIAEALTASARQVSPGGREFTDLNRMDAAEFVKGWTL